MPPGCPRQGRREGVRLAVPLTRLVRASRCHRLHDDPERRLPGRPLHAAHRRGRRGRDGVGLQLQRPGRPRELARREAAQLAGRACGGREGGASASAAGRASRGGGARGRCAGAGRQRGGSGAGEVAEGREGKVERGGGSQQRVLGGRDREGSRSRREGDGRSERASCCARDCRWRNAGGAGCPIPIPHPLRAVAGTARHGAARA